MAVSEPRGALTPDATAFRATVARMLRPLVRLCLKRGMTFQSLTDLLKELYVSVAEQDFSLQAKEQTDSRVSLLTGIHRKEVSRLRGSGAPVNVTPAHLSRASRILAHWLASPDFVDERGLPRPLPRSAMSGGASFESLVAAITKDVRPRAILDEWIHRGIVTVDDQDCITLQEEALVSRGSEQQLYYFGRNLHDHVAAASANVSETSPRFFERAVHYDQLSLATIQHLERQARQVATEALRESNRQAHEASQADQGGAWRINFGTYIFIEEAKPAAASTAREDPDQ